jgi:hypothetical protein
VDRPTWDANARREATTWRQSATGLVGSGRVVERRRAALRQGFGRVRFTSTHGFGGPVVVSHGLTLEIGVQLGIGDGHVGADVQP